MIFTAGPTRTSALRTENPERRHSDGNAEGHVGTPEFWSLLYDTIPHSD